MFKGKLTDEEILVLGKYKHPYPVSKGDMDTVNELCRKGLMHSVMKGHRLYAKSTLVSKETVSFDDVFFMLAILALTSISIFMLWGICNC